MDGRGGQEDGLLWHRESCVFPCLSDRLIIEREGWKVMFTFDLRRGSRCEEGAFDGVEGGGYQRMLVDFESIRRDGWDLFPAWGFFR